MTVDLRLSYHRASMDMGHQTGAGVPGQVPTSFTRGPTRVEACGFCEIWRYDGLDQAHAPTPVDLALYPGVRYADEPHRTTVWVPRSLSYAWGRPQAVFPTAPPVLWPSLTRMARGYQRDAYRQLQAHSGGYLCLPPGAGKTASLVALAAARGGRVLIVGRRSLATTWADELTVLGFLTGRRDPRWAALRTRPTSTEETMPTAEELAACGLQPRAQWVFCHPEIVKAWAGFLVAFDSLIVDEAHDYGNSKTLQTQGARMAANLVHRRGGLVLAASGTPLTNQPRRLWSVLDILEPGAWGSEFDYRRRYCGVELGRHGWVDTGVSHEAELKARLEYTMFFRTREEIGQQLPPLTTTLLASDASDRLRRQSKLILGADPEKVLNALLRGQNLSTLTLEYIGKFLGLTSLEKVPTTVEHCNSLLTQGRSPLVFTSRLYSSEAIRSGLRKVWPKSVFLADGTLSKSRRDEQLDAFRSTVRRGEVACLVTTYQALGVGVNLQEADDVVHHDLTWEPHVHIQATARARREGRKYAVGAYFVYAKGTIDEVLARALSAKITHIGVVDGNVQTPEWQAFVDVVKQDDISAWFNYAREVPDEG